MDIASLHGAGPFGRRIGRRDGDDPRPGEERIERSPARSHDAASISDDGLDALAKAEQHTRRLRSEEGVGRQQAAEIRARLASGELDSPEVYRAVAEKLLGGLG